MRRSTDVLSVLSTDDLADYDVISDGPRSMESSIADLGQAPKYAGGEPAPLPSAREKFGTVGLTAEDIQAHVQRSLGAQPDARTWRVYVDGVFGPLTPRYATMLVSFFALCFADTVRVQRRAAAPAGEAVLSLCPASGWGVRGRYM